CADLAFGGGDPVPLTPVGRSLCDARPEVAADAEVGGGRPPDPPRCPPGEGADATGAERVQTEALFPFPHRPRACERSRRQTGTVVRVGLAAGAAGRRPRGPTGGMLPLTTFSIRP